MILILQKCIIIVTEVIIEMREATLVMTALINPLIGLKGQFSSRVGTSSFKPATKHAVCYARASICIHTAKISNTSCQ